MPLLRDASLCSLLANQEKMANAAAVASRRSRRSSIRSLLEYAIFRLMETVLRFLPATWVDALGWNLGACAYHLLPARRDTVRRNCRIAWGDSLSAEELETLTRDTFRHCGANLLSSTRCMLMSDEQIKTHVTIEGEEIVRETLQRTNRGAIFALVHMGNWEILARIGTLVAPGAPTAAFYRPLNNPWMNRMTMRRRARSGTQLFSNKEGFTQSCPLLREGGLLGILADQHAGHSGSMTPFFGRPTSCSPLVELLHRRTGAAVFYFSVKRTRRAHWQIQITPHPPAVAISTDTVMQGLERALSSSPCDGFWFHNRWKLAPKLPFRTHRSRRSTTTANLTKPWRIALIGSSDPAINAAAASAIEFLIRQQADTAFELINTASTSPFPHASRHVADSGENLASLLRKIDASRPYPLDMVVYFCDSREINDAHRKIPIPQAVGMSSDKNHLLDIRIAAPPTPLTSPQTWWHFLSKLGITLNDPPP